jgi:hypothetical protein
VLESFHPPERLRRRLLSLSSSPGIEIDAAPVHVDALDQ